MTAGTTAALWQPWKAGLPTGIQPQAVSSGQAVTPPPVASPSPDPDALAQHETFMTNDSGDRVKLRITIDSLERTGEEVRLDATVTNISTTGATADLYSMLGTPAWDLRDVVLTPAGTRKQLHPIVEGDACTCTTWSSYANAIDPNESISLHAVFPKVPVAAEKVDLDLLELGRYKALPIDA